MKYVHVGFTGARAGLTSDQESTLKGVLLTFRKDGARFFHHGDCIGADSFAHDIAKHAGYIIVIHPPISNAHRAFRDGDVLFERKTYLARNHDIALASHHLIATPMQHSEILRSGTWATIRYFRKLGKKPLIIFPDGSSELN